RHSSRLPRSRPRNLQYDANPPPSGLDFAACVPRRHLSGRRTAQHGLRIITARIRDIALTASILCPIFHTAPFVASMFAMCPEFAKNRDQFKASPFGRTENREVLRRLFEFLQPFNKRL